jgi:hypothetical protein
MLGAIDGTHISIAKPSSAYYEDYFFHTKRCIISMVNDQKRFMDVYVGLFQSVNDFCVLRKSKLYQHAIHMGLFDMATRSQDGIPLYLFGNKRYPLLPWLMTPHKENGEVYSVLQLLYSHKHKKGRLVFENAFDILKQTFRKLLEKDKTTHNYCSYCVFCMLSIPQLVIMEEKGGCGRAHVSDSN